MSDLIDIVLKHAGHKEWLVPVETALLLAENKGRGEREGILGDCAREGKAGL